ncbi:MAG: hypothetical protein GX535_06190 [Xanthomonadaceae bacterium]|nr:hypothetical protein [Xanthomonadaceae bacterium]
MKQDKQHSKHSMTEVELDTVELVALTPIHQGAASQPLSPYGESSTLQTYDEEIAALGMPLPSESEKCVLPKRRLLDNRALGIFGIVLITSAGLVAHQVASTKPAPEPVVAMEWTPLPERGELDPIAEMEEEPEPPTLFANPFDPTEVFELEPGLTKEEARQRVAEILLERARERMASR